MTKSLLILLLIMCLMACRSSYQAGQSTRSDSLLIKEIRSTTFVPVPRSQVMLNLSKNQIDSLPSGAVYTKKRGQATAAIRKQGDSIFVYAICDSLMMQCLKYEKEITRMSSQAESYKQEVKREGFFTAFKWCLTGVLIGFIAGVISIKLRRKKYEK